MYCTGNGVPQDFRQAIVWYERAAELGNVLAQYNLAVMLAKGKGCEPDRVAAQSWFAKAAERGLPPAQTAFSEFANVAKPATT